MAHLGAPLDQHDRDHLHIEVPMRTDTGERSGLSLWVSERELDVLLDVLRRNGSTRIRVNGEERFFEVGAAA